MWGDPDAFKVISYPPYNFSWIEQNKLAAMACPSSEANYQFLKDQGIHHILSLSPENIPSKLKLWEFGWSRIDVEEFEAPTVENILEFLDLCQKCRARKQVSSCDITWICFLFYRINNFLAKTFKIV